MFIVALYLPLCMYLHELPDVTPQLYADNLKCVSSNPERLLRAAQFTSAYVRLVGQEPSVFWGTDCVEHMLRAATDSDPDATILSVDGIGAYDHVLRAALLGRLATMPRARDILPFVCLSYANPSLYNWWDDAGRKTHNRTG